MVETGTKGVFFDVHIDGKELASLIKFTKTFGYRSLAVANGFDFGSSQYNPSGKLIEKLVFKTRFFVLYVDSFLHAPKLTTYF